MFAVARVGPGSEHINVYPRPTQETKINNKIPTIHSEY